MTVSLTKGGNVSLEKVAPGMTKMLAGLGWDCRATDGADFDLDASVFLLGENGKVIDDKSFIFYNNLKLVRFCYTMIIRKHAQVWIVTLISCVQEVRPQTLLRLS